MAIAIDEQNIISASSQLADPDVMKQVEFLVDDYALQISPLQSFVFLQNLNRAVGFAQLDGQTMQFYRRQLLLLQFGAFSFLKADEQNKLLQNSLVTALRAGIDVKAHIEHIFLPDFLGSVHERKVRELTQSLEGCSERLGNNPIRLGGQVEAQVKNWLLDFKNSSGGKQSAYEIVNYLTNSENAKQLSTEDREILRDILVLYRWLKFEAVPENYLEPASPETSQGGPAESSLFEVGKIQTPPPAPRPVPRPTLAPQPPRMVPPVTPQPRPVRIEPLHPLREHITQKPEPTRPFVRPISREPAFSQVKPSSAAVAGLDRVEREDEYREPASLSGVLISHGSGSTGQAGTRVGQKTEKFSNRETEEHKNRRVEELKDRETEQRSAEKLSNLAAEKPSDEGAEDLTKVFAEKAAVSVHQKSIEEPRKKEVVDLKNVNLDVSTIADPIQLSRIKLPDLRKSGFENGLGLVKTKIQELSQSRGMPVKQIAASFFRSPAYAQYVNTVVAITNDTGGDQKAAFERVTRSLASAGKEYLNRDEFLAMHRFKKEISE